MLRAFLFLPAGWPLFVTIKKVSCQVAPAGNCVVFIYSFGLCETQYYQNLEVVCNRKT